MGVGDSARKMAGKAKEAVDPEKAKEGVDKAADQVDEATGGKAKDKVDKGQDAAKEGIDKLSGDES